MKIEALSLGELGTNCYVLSKEDKALIIDPGGEPEKVTQLITKNNYKPLAILLTHAHFDHIGGVDHLRSIYNVEVYLHMNEHKWLEDPQLNRSLSFTRQQVITAPPEQELKPGELRIGPFDFEVVHTPGHSPGSVSFINHDFKFVIGGDVLFQRGIGRTDLPGGSLEQLEYSIKRKLYTLADDYTVFPGHGPTTMIGDEKAHNPFVSMN